MFAIIKAGGRQVRVRLGETVSLDRLRAEPGSTYENDQILMAGEEEGEISIGMPLLEGAKVSGTILNHQKDKKVIIFKRRRRKGYRKKQGHRQQKSLVKIETINL